MKKVLCSEMGKYGPFIFGFMEWCLRWNQSYSKVFTDSNNKLREVCYQDDKSKGHFKRQKKWFCWWCAAICKGYMRSDEHFCIKRQTKRRRKICPENRLRWATHF